MRALACVLSLSLAAAPGLQAASLSGPGTLQAWQGFFAQGGYAAAPALAGLDFSDSSRQETFSLVMTHAELLPESLPSGDPRAALPSLSAAPETVPGRTAPEQLGALLGVHGGGILEQIRGLRKELGKEDAREPRHAAELEERANRLFERLEAMARLIESFPELVPERERGPLARTYAEVSARPDHAPVSLGKGALLLARLRLPEAIDWIGPGAGLDSPPARSAGRPGVIPNEAKGLEPSSKASSPEAASAKVPEPAQDRSDPRPPAWARGLFAAAMSAVLLAVPPLVSAAVPALDMRAILPLAHQDMSRMMLGKLAFVQALELSVLLLPLFWLASALFEKFFMTENDKLLVEDAARDIQEHPGAAFVFYTILAAGEELLMRGMLFFALFAWLGSFLPIPMAFALASLPSAWLFGRLHKYESAWLAGLPGMMFNAVFAMTGSLLLTFLIHFYFNVIAFGTMILHLWRESRRAKP